MVFFCSNVDVWSFFYQAVILKKPGKENLLRWPAQTIIRSMWKKPFMGIMKKDALAVTRALILRTGQDIWSHIGGNDNIFRCKSKHPYLAFRETLHLHTNWNECLNLTSSRALLIFEGVWPLIAFFQRTKLLESLPRLDMQSIYLAIFNP